MKATKKNPCKVCKAVAEPVELFGNGWWWNNKSDVAKPYYYYKKRDTNVSLHNTHVRLKDAK